MTRKTLRIAGLVFATLGLGTMPGQSARATTTKHKKSTGATTPSTNKPKSATTSHSSGATTKSAGTASGKAGAAKKSSGSTSSKHGGKKASHGHQRGQMAPTPERITEIQQALSKSGDFSGAPSGKWDDSTADAMRKFQAAHGLNATGKLDAQTLNHLGLGSATAGMAPPAPTVRTSAAALPADIQQ